MTTHENSGDSKKRKPRGGGRPRKQDDQKRTIIHKLYLNQEESARINSMLQASNFQSMNEFIRAMVLENSVKIYFEDKNRENIIYHLSKIGGNVNQIAVNMNRMKHTYNSVSPRELNVLEDLRMILEELKL